MSGRIWSGAELTADVDVEADVAIVGSGAGGAMLAAGLVEAGLRVVMLEEGGHHTRKEFGRHEAESMPMLYQERGTRGTADLAISILQGRAVGGTTVINWTTCFRTPDAVLAHWASKHGITGLSSADLAPHFDAVEARLNIHPWPDAMVNANNAVLREGCQKLGWAWGGLRRNVNGCANSGMCGLGCPVDGKQSMLVTCVPDAIAGGLQLYADTRAVRIETDGDRVIAVHGEVLTRGTEGRTGRKVRVRPKVLVVSGGAINTPALLLRSQITDGPVGQRTFLHPVVGMAGRYGKDIDGFYGAPQSVGSHHFAERGEDVGFFLETAPMQPLLISTAFPQFGAKRAAWMADLRRTGTLIALSIDGFHDGVEGGTVSLRSDGRVRIDYPIGPKLEESFRASMKAMAQIALAAGAERVWSLHPDEVEIRTEADIAKLDAAPYGALQHSIFTAHQMGGCAMGPEPASSVVDTDLRHHRVKNLFVVDGSVLPTSLGVNPSETVYALAHRARAVVAAAAR